MGSDTPNQLGAKSNMNGNSPAQLGAKQGQYGNKDGTEISNNNIRGNSENVQETEEQETSTDRPCSDDYPDPWVCTDGGCVRQHWVCDRIEDCRDGSDEYENCGRSSSIRRTNMSANHALIWIYKTEFTFFIIEE